MPRWAIIVAFAAFLLAVPVRADVLVERNGRQLQGTLTGVEDSLVVFTTTAGRVVRIPRGEIERIVFPEMIRVGAGTLRSLDRSGRVDLAVWGTLYGIMNGGFVAGSAEFHENGFVTLMLAGGAAGFYIPWQWGRERPLSDARAQLISFGGSWGTWQGLGWANVIPEGAPDKAWRVLVPGIAAGAAGTIGAALVTGRYDVSEGDATLITTVPFWATGIWGWMLVLVEADDGDFILGSLLAAGDAGVLCGALLARRMEESSGKIRLTNIGAVLGGLAGGAAIVLGNIDSPRLGSSIVMGGAMIGAGAAWHLQSRGSDESATGIKLRPTVLAGRRGAVPGFAFRAAF